MSDIQKEVARLSSLTPEELVREARAVADAQDSPLLRELADLYEDLNSMSEGHRD